LPFGKWQLLAQSGRSYLGGIGRLWRGGIDVPARIVEALLDARDQPEMAN
jgi:hypothetical protein